MDLFVFGCGYTGLTLARRLIGRGLCVGGTSRSLDGRARLAAEGLAAVDPNDADALEQALQAPAVLVSTPPDGQGCPAYRALSPLIGRRRPWIGYLSTTGVYGDRDGGWVDETSALRAATVEGCRRVGAETDWRRLDARLFRLPGIYGPGRSAFDRLREGAARRLDKPGHVFSRIHVDDICTALEAALARPEAQGVFNLCDDEPAPAEAPIAWAASLMGVPAPALEPFEPAILSPMARRFWSESKRVANARAKSALGWRPRHPTYREGLAAILAAGG